MSEAGFLLIVDDEPAIAGAVERLARHTLKEARIQTASSPEEAMRILDGVVARDLVVISDYNMGARMNGIELLGWVGERHPGAHRFLMTGYAIEELEDELKRPIALRCVPKPFSRAQLHAAFAALLPRPDA